MIILRRLLTIPLGFLLFVLLLVALIVLQVGGTFLNPGFYPEELRKAEFYEFLLVEVTTSALDEARERVVPEHHDCELRAPCAQPTLEGNEFFGECAKAAPRLRGEAGPQHVCVPT